MLKKTTLKEELSLPAVAVINELLRAAGRRNKGQGIEDADADLIRRAVPFWRKGHSYQESIRLATEEAVAQHSEPEQTSNGHPTNNGNGAVPGGLTVQDQARQQTAMQQKANQALSRQATLTKAVEDEIDNQSFYWTARAFAANSPQVQHSEEVTAAREFYFAMQSGDVFDADVVGYEELHTFFGGDSLEQLPAEMPQGSNEMDSFSPEPYSCVSGNEFEN